MKQSEKKKKSTSNFSEMIPRAANQTHTRIQIPNWVWQLTKTPVKPLKDYARLLTQSPKISIGCRAIEGCFVSRVLLQSGSIEVYGALINKEFIHGCIVTIQRGGVCRH